MLKSRLLTVLSMAMMFTSFSHNAVAASVFATGVGARIWQTSPNANFGEAKDALVQLDVAKRSQYSWFITLEHPLPLVPNIKVNVGNNDDSSSATLTQTYRLNQQVYSVATPLKLNNQYNYVDLALYYEVFENNLIEFDVGATLRYNTADYSVQSKVDASASETSVSNLIPMIYSKLELGLPLMGLSFYGDVYQGADSNYEYEVGLAYDLLQSMVMDMAIVIGNRAQQINFDNVDGLYAKQKWQSTFIGLDLRF